MICVKLSCSFDRLVLHQGDKDTVHLSLCSFRKNNSSNASTLNTVDVLVYCLCPVQSTILFDGHHFLYWPCKLNFPQDNNWHCILYLMRTQADSERGTDLCAPLIIDFYFAEPFLRNVGLYYFFAERLSQSLSRPQ